MSAGYALAYRLGVTPWEQAGEAAQGSFDRLLAREEWDRVAARGDTHDRVTGRAHGRALDLGCGRGAHTHELAARGWDAVGVDDVTRAVDIARGRGHSGATFVVGDVTRLDEAALGTFDFFLDIGCFHGLSAQDRMAEAAGVTRLANPGATVLLLAFRPNRLPLLPAGVAAEAVTTAFDAWDLLSVEPADVSGMPRPVQKTAPDWYRLRLR